MTSAGPADPTGVSARPADPTGASGGAGAVPAVVTPAVVGSFPWSVLHDRHPKLVAGVRDAHPYGPGPRRALDALVAETLTGVIGRLPADAADADRWETWGAGYFGRSWFDVPFLFAESYFYRRLLDAVGYFAPGPWRGVDPFAYLKSAEARDATAAGAPGERTTPGAAADRPGAGGTGRGPATEPVGGLRELLVAAVWGNRADLSFRIGRPGGPAARPTSARSSWTTPRRCAPRWTPDSAPPCAWSPTTRAPNCSRTWRSSTTCWPRAGASGWRCT